MRIKKWSDKKEELFKELWPKYVSDELERKDMEKIFGASLDSLRQKAYARKMETSKKDNFIDEEYLRKIRKMRFDI